MKQVTKEDTELILFKLEEGFDYCFCDYSDWKEETEGTKLEPLIKNYREAKEALEAGITELQEEHGLSDENGEEEE